MPKLWDSTTAWQRIWYGSPILDRQCDQRRGPLVSLGLRSLVAVGSVCVVSTCISATQAALRSHLSAHLRLALRCSVPLRIFFANLINCAATAQAIHQFVIARIFGSRLKWRKTEHVYDGSVVQVSNRPRIGEVLVRLRTFS